MRKTIAIFISVFALVACSPEPFVNILTENIPDFEPGEVSVDVKISTLNGWTATASQKWVTISPSSGEGGEATIHVTASANPDFNDRSAIVYINSDDITKTFTIIQKEAHGIIIDDLAYTVQAKGAEITIPLSTNTSFTTTVESSAKEWLSVINTKASFEKHEVVVKALENTTAYARQGKVTITAGLASKTVTFYQDSQSTFVKIVVNHSGNSLSVNCNGTDFSGEIDWGDGSRSDIISENTHEYASNDEKKATINTKEADSIIIPNINNIELIDLFYVRK